MTSGRRLTIEEVKQMLFNIHGDVVTLDESTYIDTQTKCKFIDKDYGEWWATPNNVLSNKRSHMARQQEKSRQTCLERYGVEYSIRNKEIRERTEQTCLKKYGYKSPIKSEQVQEKIKQINMEKHGYENPFLCKEIQEKIKQTNLEKYGCEHPAQTKQIKEKSKQTCLKRYGCEYATQDEKVASKAARNSNNSTILTHWKTGKEVVCVASYEKKVVEHLNRNQIDYVWQIRFDMPNGKKYFVDAYLPDKDIYIEIKGYMRPKSKLKWDWFHKEHPNSELWNKEKLKELKIL